MKYLICACVLRKSIRPDVLIQNGDYFKMADAPTAQKRIRPISLDENQSFYTSNKFKLLLLNILCLSKKQN